MPISLPLPWLRRFSDDWPEGGWSEAWLGGMLMFLLEMLISNNQTIFRKYVRLPITVFLGSVVGFHLRLELIPILGRVMALGPSRNLVILCAVPGVYFSPNHVAGRLIPTSRAVTPNQQGRSCQSRPATKGPLPLANRKSSSIIQLLFRNIHAPHDRQIHQRLLVASHTFHRQFDFQTFKMAPKAADKKPASKAPATASKAPEKKDAGKKTAPSGEKKKRTKARKETYSSYIYKGEFALSGRDPGPETAPARARPTLLCVAGS